MTTLLRVDELGKVFSTSGKAVRAVDAVTMHVDAGESVGVVGESGSGKTTLARIILGIEKPSFGGVTFRGEPLPAGYRKAARAARRDIQMVFQNPYSSIDPRFTVFQSVAEPLRAHTSLSRRDRMTKVSQLLEQVHMPNHVLNRYAHELSGGQLQRVAIARAIALEPSLVILDEPTSALDVSVQAHILSLLGELRVQHNLSFLLITHDLGVVRTVCERAVVMLRGRVVETATVPDLFTGRARHPYTEKLLASMPSVHNVGKRAVRALETDVLVRPEPIH